MYEGLTAASFLIGTHAVYYYSFKSLATLSVWNRVLGHLFFIFVYFV